MNIKHQKIIFVVPGGVRTAVGGYKIAFTYADELSKLGFNCVIYTIHESRKPQSLLEILKAIYWAVLSWFRSPYSWFIFRSVKVKHIPWFGKPWIASNDLKSGLFIAVGAQATEIVLLAVPKERIVNFIQGMESWSYTEERLKYLYRSCQNAVVISGWLSRVLTNWGLPTVIIKNPSEPNVFYETTPYLLRPKYSIGFMYHRQPLKATNIALNCIVQLKTDFPTLQAFAFGTDSHPEIPNWIKYHPNPSQKDLNNLYNSFRIFLAPSLSEGWGLTPSEAMQSGCVVIASNIEGHQEFCHDSVNSVLVPAGDESAMYRATIKAFQDEHLSNQISKAAPQELRDMSLASAIKKWVNLLEAIDI